MVTPSGCKISYKSLRYGSSRPLYQNIKHHGKRWDNMMIMTGISCACIVGLSCYLQYTKSKATAESLSRVSMPSNSSISKISNLAATDINTKNTKKLLITGGNGNIGTKLISFLKNKYEITVIDRSEPSSLISEYLSTTNEVQFNFEK